MPFKSQLVVYLEGDQKVKVSLLNEEIQFGGPPEKLNELEAALMKRILMHLQIYKSQSITDLFSQYIREPHEVARRDIEVDI